MRTKLILGAVVAALLATASVPLTAAGDGSDGQRGHKGDVLVIDLTANLLQEALIDERDEGPSVGDRFIFSDDIVRDGKSVGTDGIDCVVVLIVPGKDPAGEPERVAAQCTASLSLPEGQITAQGLVDFTQTEQTIAITGGTGTYRTAHGEVHVTDVSDEVANYRLTVIL
jgi:hypothetical protein